MNGLDRMRWLMKMPMLSWMVMLCLLKSLSVTHAEDAVASLERETSALVIYNADMPASKKVAEHYGQLRGIPQHHLLGLSLSQEESISREDFKKALYEPIFAYLKKNCLLYTSPSPRD